MAQTLNRRRSRGKSEIEVTNDLDVFINCPFDADYKPIFNAIVFTVVRSGYRARCALETDDAAENRLGKIMKIIGECPFGVHDISRTEVGGDPPVPRFNMPLELGLWLGAKEFGGRSQQAKKCIVFDRERYRYPRYISDIAGQDIHSHNGRVNDLIAELAPWLRHLPGGVHAGGGQALVREYRQFEAVLPSLCESKDMTIDEIHFSDFNLFVAEYVSSLVAPPSYEENGTEPVELTIDRESGHPVVVDR